MVKWKWSTREIRRYADYVPAQFGPRGVMVGSNWPVVELSGTFDEVWSGLTELIAGLAPSELAAVLGGSAQRIYGI